ncbi:acyl-CoA dehydrogenase [Robiginitalea sp. SC105]|uniref:acyl-CoA dehydrogenase family protein n=1 Tax=Robiginitalea sp. SC105 TaxID=2762332 RepID=UPI00163A20EE|nr:acyl-CoA dehydrogenase [Robiginitalea sp. SC105]MBC2838766.1 acyl-CoA dehydrogenase family protein [Robiginitalea sp. SC105]
MQTHSYSRGIYPYLPVFYVIWSDDLLSASEIAVVEKAIDGDPGLSPPERKLLRSWLDRDAPPASEELKYWNQLIADSGVSYREDAAYPLSEFSAAFADAQSPGGPGHPVLKDIEVNLGIQPIHYRHLFGKNAAPVAVASDYSGEALADLSLGSHARSYRDYQEFLNRPEFEWQLIREKEAHRNRVLDQLRLLAGQGYGALAYPSEFGGKSDMPAYAALFENLMFVDASLCVKFGVQFGLFGGSIQKLGNDRQREQYLADAGAARLLGCFAMSETRHGSNVRGIRTTATYVKERDELVIQTPGPDDNKEWIGNVLHAEMATVFTQLIVDGENRGVHAILVPLRDPRGEVLPGIRIEDNGYKLGLNGIDNGKIWFDQVVVPRANLLDRYGTITDEGTYHSDIANPNKRFFTMLGTLVGGRICVAKGALAGARFGLAIAVKYALRRRQFNDAKRVQEDLIMDYPSHQLRLLPAVAGGYIYQVALDQLMARYESAASDPDMRQLEAGVAGLKALVTEFADRTLQECREACGGKGYLLENRIAQLKNDVDIFTTFEGDNTVLLQLAAKSRLTDFRDEFNSDDFFGVVKLLGTQLGKRLAAVNPAYTNKTDREHLYNPAFHRHALTYRTERLTYTLALRIRDYIKKGMPSYQAFLKVQTHLLALGRAYAAQLAFDLFRDFAERLPDDAHANLIRKLGTLHALSEIRSDATWYLEQGYIGKRKSRAIRGRVERLCSEVRPHAQALVEGYGIPAYRLGNVPIVG